ncbi:ATP-binding protein [Lachnospiraceae bacterium 38-14]|jgi:two-component system phosphate regulon sensor histidine kinase PhoR|uniref:Histidine kinase n=1 Tax=Hominisplanchenecus murintestinalis TaxID=2941517 RepID=A0AC61QYX1_9FIRM|nr:MULTISPECIES: ATP-binding protein [Bacteria]MCX4353653.1 ATP-binding protein [Lachnospiraceae bacterium]RKI30244.1 histidine kinase [bacterium D16-36]RKI72180.1 histidine kinase [bacterium 1xD8-6]RKJ77689.1 histidine kinase [Anaerotruncus sp. 1XD22-93]NBH99434.1 histidine kinase [Lachnospiraceae bacterium]
MNKKIFRSSLLTVCLVLAATIALIMGLLFHFFEKQIQKELANEAGFLAHALENEGAGYFDSFDNKNNRLAGNNRITWIDENGTVLFDSRADVSELDNHADRDEIKTAMKEGKGMSTRYSKTLTEKTVNYAIRLSDGSILRVSTEQYTVVTILMGMLQPILFIMFVALILTLVLSARVSKAIIEPINKLDLEIPENNDTYEELTPLLRKIADQKETIGEQLADARKKQKEFNLITENMSEGFLVIDADANLLTYNSAALNLLEITPPADRSVLLFCRAKEFRGVISDVLSGIKAENTMVREERSYSLIANPVYEKESVIGAVVVILDITEREKRDMLRREFTANVSHELKTPLTSISGFAELMKAGDVLENDVTDFSKSIYDEAQRLITLVNDIIKISELDGQSIPYEKETVDLYELSKEVIGRLEKEADKKNITFHLIGGRAEIIGVHKILEEMLYNLCDNAIKYNKENGTVDVLVNQTGDGVNVIVRDTGIGIPISHQDRVFERFYRVDKSHSKKVGGTGLGLAIVKHGALYHHAKLSLESTVDVGTVVTIAFSKK